MKEKNEPYMFYIIIIIIFAATLYMAQQMKSSSPAVKQVKEEVTLKHVAALCVIYIGITFGIFGMLYHISSGYKGIELFNHTKVYKRLKRRKKRKRHKTNKGANE